MNNDLPDDWSIPTFREIAEPVSTFGMPPEHFSLAIMLGSMPSMLLIFVSAFGKSFMAFIYAFALAMIVIPAIMWLFRNLYKADHWWFEHLSTHRYPAERYLGK